MQYNFLTAQRPFAAGLRPAITEPGTHGSHRFHKISQTDQTPAKVQTLGQKRIQDHRKEKERFLLLS